MISYLTRSICLQSYFTETRLSELKFEMDHMNEISQHLSSATVDNEETAHLYGKLQIYQSTVPELRKQAASIDMLTTQVSILYHSG